MNAQYTLGLMYNNGAGVPQNYVMSYVWLSVATAQGKEDAKEFRDSVSELWLTPDQLARGQEIATKCFESGYQDCK